MQIVTSASLKHTFFGFVDMCWGDISIYTKAKSLPKEMKADSPDAIESLKEGSVRSVICTGDNVWCSESRGPQEHPSQRLHKNKNPRSSRALRLAGRVLPEGMLSFSMSSCVMEESAFTFVTSGESPLHCGLFNSRALSFNCIFPGFVVWSQSAFVSVEPWKMAASLVDMVQPEPRKRHGETARRQESWYGTIQTTRDAPSGNPEPRLHGTPKPAPGEVSPDFPDAHCQLALTCSAWRHLHEQNKRELEVRMSESAKQSGKLECILYVYT